MHYLYALTLISLSKKENGAELNVKGRFQKVVQDPEITHRDEVFGYLHRFAEIAHRGWISSDARERSSWIEKNP